MNKWCAGVDIGGTKIESGAVNQEGQVLEKRRIPTPVSDGAEGVLQAIIAEVCALSESMGSAPEAVGVGIAGQVEKGSGLVFFAPNLHWKDVPLRAQMEESLHCPVSVVNDVRAGTWGEWRHGAGRGVDDLICIFIGTGVGGGVVSGGRILEGAGNCAGEIGHMVVDLFGPPCACGNHGCLESLGGGWAIARNAKEALTTDPRQHLLLRKLAGVGLEKLTAREVLQAAAESDPIAMEVLDRAYQAYVASTVSLVNGYNPSRLIIGGGLGEALPELLPILKEGIEKKALRAASASVDVCIAALHGEANVVGAATIAWEGMQ